MFELEIEDREEEKCQQPRAIYAGYYLGLCLRNDHLIRLSVFISKQYKKRGEALIFETTVDRIPINNIASLKSKKAGKKV